MFNIRKKISHYRRLAKFKLTSFLTDGDARFYSGFASEYRHKQSTALHERKRQLDYWSKHSPGSNSSFSRKKAPSTNFWTGKRQTHSHKAYRHRMASVRRSNRSHAPGGAWSKSSRSWY